MLVGMFWTKVLSALIINLERAWTFLKFHPVGGLPLGYLCLTRLLIYLFTDTPRQLQYK